MEYDEVILNRRSVRGYLRKPVPRELIEEIIALVMRAPSSYNSQPWHFHAISGEPLERIRAGNVERMVAGVPESREFRAGSPYAGAHRERQVGVAKQLFTAMGIAREDKAGREDWMLRRSTGRWPMATTRSSTAAGWRTRWSTRPGRAGSAR